MNKITQRTSRIVGLALGSALLMLSGTGAQALGTGIASFYGKGDGFHGRKTANGERYDRYSMTAAHRTLPFGTKVRVTNLRNGKSVIVRINNRGPFVRGRIIDVSYAAAQQLGFAGQGITRVSVVPMGRSAF